MKLTGSVGMETKEFAYDLKFPEKTNDDTAFVEEIWARRKVGYLLDQIRANGEKTGAERRGDRAGEEVWHHDAVHQLADRAGRPSAGGRSAKPGGGARRRLWRRSARRRHRRPWTGPAGRPEAGRRVRQGTRRRNRATSRRTATASRTIG